MIQKQNKNKNKAKTKTKKFAIRYCTQPPLSQQTGTECSHSQKKLVFKRVRSGCFCVCVCVFLSLFSFFFGGGGLLPPHPTAPHPRPPPSPSVKGQCEYAKRRRLSRACRSQLPAGDRGVDSCVEFALVPVPGKCGLEEFCNNEVLCSLEMTAFTLAIILDWRTSGCWND